MTYTRGWPYRRRPASGDGQRSTKEAKLALSRRVELLADVPLFDGLSKQQLRAIARVASVRSHPSGGRVVTEGSKTASCFVIVDGSAEVFKGETHVTTLGPGDVIGEISLFDRAPRSATVYAATETVLLQVSRPGLLSVLEENPKVALRLLETLAHRLRVTTEAAGSTS